MWTDDQIDEQIDELAAVVAERLTRIVDREWLPPRRVRPAPAQLEELPRPGWRDRALCATAVGDWFSYKPDYELAVCDACRVSDDCYVFGASQPYGIWGGTTASERLDIKP